MNLANAMYLKVDFKINSLQEASFRLHFFLNLQPRNREVGTKYQYFCLCISSFLIHSIYKKQNFLYVYVSKPFFPLSL